MATLSSNPGNLSLAVPSGAARTKAVFFDIDGTLVPFRAKGIPESTRAALAALRAGGVRTFIATGRHLSWTGNVADTPFDGYVTVNGGMCVAGDRKTVLYCRPIPADDMQRLETFIERTKIPFVVVPADGDIFITGINPLVEEAADLLNITAIPVRPIAEARGKEVVQLMGFFTPDEQERSGVFGDALRGCEPTRWCPLFTDIIPCGGSKAAGIDRMIAHFGISLSETMAFGDGDNDVAMLRHTAVGVAMGNASAAVKAAADYVTLPADEDGVGEALRRFALI